jgi:hypothetical protein
VPGHSNEKYRPPEPKREMRRSHGNISALGKEREKKDKDTKKKIKKKKKEKKYKSSGENFDPFRGIFLLMSRFNNQRKQSKLQYSRLFLLEIPSLYGKLPVRFYQANRLHSAYVRLDTPSPNELFNVP